MSKKDKKKKKDEPKGKSFTRENRPKGVSVSEWDKARKSEGKSPNLKFYADPKKAKKLASKSQGGYGQGTWRPLTAEEKAQADDYINKVKETTFQNQQGGVMSVDPNVAKQKGYTNPFQQTGNPLGIPEQPQVQSVMPQKTATQLSEPARKQADTFLGKIKNYFSQRSQSEVQRGKQLVQSNMDFLRAPLKEKPGLALKGLKQVRKGVGEFVTGVSEDELNNATSTINQRNAELTKKFLAGEISDDEYKNQSMQSLFKSPEAHQRTQATVKAVVSFMGAGQGVVEKEIAKSQSPDLIKSILRGKLSDETIDKTMPQLIKASTPQEVKAVIDTAKNLTSISEIVTGKKPVSQQLDDYIAGKHPDSQPQGTTPLQEGGRQQADKIINDLVKESGTGTIKVYHGTDTVSAGEIKKSGMFKSGESQPSFFTTSKKEALEYAKNKSKYRGGKPEVMEIEVPKWAITKNNAGEIETHLNVPLHRDFGNVYRPKDEDVIKAFSQPPKITPSEKTILPLNKIDSEKLSFKVNTKNPKIQGFVESYKSGQRVPEIPVYKEGDRYVLNKDGYDRYFAAKEAGVKNVRVEVQPKTIKTPYQKQLEERAKFASVSTPYKSTEQLTQKLNSQLKGKEEYTYNQNLAQTGKNVKPRGFIESLRNSPEVSVNLSKKATELNQTYKVERNSPKLQQAQELVFSNPTEAERIAKNELDDKAVFTGSELIKQYDLAAQKATSEVERNAFLDKAVEIADAMDTNLREHGRAIQAASAISNLSPEGVLRWATRELRIASEKGGGKIKLTNEMAGNFLKRANEIQGIGNPREKAKAVYQLFDEIHSLIPSSAGDKIISVWKAGLLTGLKTSGVNISSNILHGSMEVAKDIPATIVDSVASLFTGKRTKTLGVKGTGGGIVEGLKKGWDFLKTGFDERNIASKYDYRKVNFGKSKIGKTIQGYEESIFKLMGAEDQPFYYGAKARSIYEQAKVAGMNNNLKGKELTSFIDNFVKSPTDEAIRNATNDAEVAVFTNANKLSDWTKGAQGPVAQFIMPFRKTPANVAMQAINYSPVGIVKTIISNIGKGKFDQRAFSQGLGRGIVGTGIFAIGGALMNKGIMTLSSPKTAKERNQWELEGKKPNSILWNGKWRQAGSLGPAGMTMLVGGYYQKALNETGSQVSALTQSVAGLGKSLVDQTFLKGVSGFLDAINDPTRYATTLYENTVGSVVPTIIGDIARSKDTLQRETNGAIESFMSRIPGARESLSPQVDVFGKNVPRGEGFLGTIADFLRSNKQRNQDNSVVNELSRLNKVGENGTPTEITDTQKVNGQDVKLDQAKVNEMKVFIGVRSERLFKELMQTDYYKSLPDDKKANELSNIASDLKSLAKHDILKDMGTFKTEDEIRKDIQNKQIFSEIDSLMSSGNITKANQRLEAMSKGDRESFNRIRGIQKPDWYKPEETKSKTQQLNQAKPGLYDQYQEKAKTNPAEADKFLRSMDYPTYEKFKKERTGARASHTRQVNEYLASETPEEAARYLDTLEKSEKQRIESAMTGVKRQRYLEAKLKYQETQKPVSQAPEQYRKPIADASTEHGVPEEILINLLKQESGFNPRAVSKAGARGIAQFMGGTAQAMGINPDNPDEAIPAAAKYLKQQYDEFGSWDLALAAYNAGPGAVRKYSGIPPYKETQNYVRSIMGNTITKTSINLIPNQRQKIDLIPNVKGGLKTNSIYYNKEYKARLDAIEAEREKELDRALDNPSLMLNYIRKYESKTI